MFHGSPLSVPGRCVSVFVIHKGSQYRCPTGLSFGARNELERTTKKATARQAVHADAMKSRLSMLHAA